jgi:hypothetical protein
MIHLFLKKSRPHFLSIETLTTKFVYVTIGSTAWSRHADLLSMQLMNPLENRRIIGDQNFGINFKSTTFVLIPYKK